jgi:transmembrane sensor
MSYFPADRRAWRTDAEWARLNERIASEPAPAMPPHRRVPWRWVSTVALAAGVVAIAVVVRLERNSGEITRRFRTAAGERLVVRLSDSSTVTLGPASSLEIRTSTAGRGARLDGLAFFDVVHDARRPFIVTAARARAVDVGTQFIVRAYAAESTVDVAVRQGSVSLSNGVGNSALVLSAGDVGVVPRALGPARLDGAASATDLDGWLRGTLAFDDASLAAVAAELSRWFDVDVSVRDGTLAKRRVTAVYRNAQLADVLDALSATLHLAVQRTGRTVVLAPAPVGPGGPR